jgi:hypothetical protein
MIYDFQVLVISPGLASVPVAYARSVASWIELGIAILAMVVAIVAVRLDRVNANKQEAGARALATELERRLDKEQAGGPQDELRMLHDIVYPALGRGPTEGGDRDDSAQT